MSKTHATWLQRTWNANIYLATTIRCTSTY